MTAGKVVCLSRRMEPESWDLFLSVKPPGWQVILVNPDDGEQKVSKELEDAEYLVATRAGNVSSQLLESAKRLKFIQHGGQGLNHIPVKWAVEKGIPVSNVGGTNAVAVAEHTMLLMLACLRRFLIFNQSVREGKGRPKVGRENTHQLYDKTVGIIGLGNIGRRVARLCYGFGANILYYERFFVPYAVRADLKAREMSLDELLSASDIVTIHVPGLKNNAGMIGWDQLTKMKPSAYLINTSRGTVVDQDALVRALNKKRIAGAGLDVWDPDPPDSKNPLLQMDNVVATPHYAGDAWENVKWAYETIWKNILLVSEGKEPISRVYEF